MAVLSKTALETNIDANITTNGTNSITGAEVNDILNDIVDSYEDIIIAYTTVQRDALTPTNGQKIYNTTTNRLEFYNGTEWVGVGQANAASIDASTNPNYPAALIGDTYTITSAGKIGGAAGTAVSAGDLIRAIAANAGGTQAAVGSSWVITFNAGSAVQSTQFIELSLTSANILALATPIDLVPAQGAGTIILPMFCVTTYTKSGSDYVGGAMKLKFNGGSNSIGNILPEFDSMTASDYAVTPFFLNLLPTTWLANTKLQVYMDSNPTAGSGTAKIQLYYKIHTL